MNKYKIKVPFGTIRIPGKVLRPASITDADVDYLKEKHPETFKRHFTAVKKAKPVNKEEKE